MRSLNEELTELLHTDVDAGLADPEADYHQLIEIMSRRIEELLSGQFETLMSMMYRLDIDENSIRRALDPANPENPASSLARLIVDRQKRRMATKRKYRQPPLEDWIDFE